MASNFPLVLNTFFVSGLPRGVPPVKNVLTSIREVNPVLGPAAFKFEDMARRIRRRA
jgi:hypothetical protein